jgi:hypothetical protein
MALAARTGTFFPDEDGMPCISFMLDIGSNVNIIGANTARTFQEVMARYNHRPAMCTLSKTLYINGVGEGAAICRKMGNFKIGVQYANEASPRIEEYASNIAEGSGVNLPAIWGLSAMEARDTIIVLKPGFQKVIFPSGEYTLKLGKGAKVLRAKKTPSGHLAIPCGLYDGAKSQTVTNTFTIRSSHDGYTETENDEDSVNAGPPAGVGAGSPAGVTAGQPAMGQSMTVTTDTFIVEPYLDKQLLKDTTRAIVDRTLDSWWKGQQCPEGTWPHMKDALKSKIFWAVQEAVNNWSPENQAGPPATPPPPPSCTGGGSTDLAGPTRVEIVSAAAPVTPAESSANSMPL